ncbi:MAG TPA: lysylphosphatidylglycerol synthase domain-containing protein [Vicinamibacterales bacterium]|nr:lysylphosphatidylglycerol synthase domain-containing protein [Vicinamibacterales bacterium]
MSRRHSQLVTSVALGLGVALFASTLWHVDFDALTGMAGRLGAALPVVLVLSGIWHLARTWSWAACFAEPLPVSFGSLARVRLAAEAFSYVTVRGVAGEPLKVMMLSGRIDSRRAAAAVALERVSYLIITTAIVGVCAVAAAASLPLAIGWFRIYSGFAIVAAVIVGASVLVARGRGVYLNAMFDLLHRATRGRLGGGGIAGFLKATEHHIVDLVRGHPHRLARLVLADLICFVAMALEVWVVSRAVGVSLTMSASVAVETFSRVASFASAFVPAGIGTSEASNIAGMTAVGVPSVGLALAAARRVRGLFWAGIGFLVYPKRLTPRTSLDLASAVMHTKQGQTVGKADIGQRFSGHVLIYLADDPRVPVSPLDRLAALPIGERVLRAADKAGYDHILVWAPASHAGLSRIAARLALRARVTIARDSGGWRKLRAGLRVPALTVIGPGTVVAPSLLEAARHAVPPPAAGYGIDIPAGDEFPQSGVLRVHVDDAAVPTGLADMLHDRWRAGVPRPDGQEVSAHRAMLALRIADSGQDLARAEAEIRRSVYKSTDPYLARVNRRMSLPISMLLLRTPMTANALSLLLVFLGFTSGWLFSLGSYATGVAAAALSLGASILDGCDGEIARLKYQESAFGCWVETIGDYTYYIAIFVGLTVGAVRYTADPIFYRIGALALAGTFITFALLIWLRRRITNGQPEKLQATAKAHFYASKKRWAWLVAKLSFCATRSTMPYGIMAFALLGILPGILVLAAIGANVYWISLAIRLPWLLAPAQPKAAARPVGDAA